jgi:E3 ubiquitin-protein ligase TRIP12
LEKISQEFSVPILQAGGLNAVLCFLDFFPTGTQRTAVSIAANICRQVPNENFGMVQEVIPILTNLLQYQDQKSKFPSHTSCTFLFPKFVDPKNKTKVVDKAVLAFTRLAEVFVGDEAKLTTISKQGLTNHLIRLLSVNNISVIGYFSSCLEFSFFVC